MEITEIYTPEELDIYSEGYESCKKGISKEDNPYEDVRLHSIWEMGWYDYIYE